MCCAALVCMRLVPEQHLALAAPDDDPGERQGAPGQHVLQEAQEPGLFVKHFIVTVSSNIMISLVATYTAVVMLL